MEEVVLLYASNGRLEGWVSLEVGGPVELLKWRSASTLEAAPMWVSPTQHTPFNPRILCSFLLKNIPLLYFLTVLLQQIF
jgi:hypothetical protein